MSQFWIGYLVGLASGLIAAFWAIHDFAKKLKWPKRGVGVESQKMPIAQFSTELPDVLESVTNMHRQRRSGNDENTILYKVLANEKPCQGSLPKLWGEKEEKQETEMKKFNRKTFHKIKSFRAWTNKYDLQWFGYSHAPIELYPCLKGMPEGKKNLGLVEVYIEVVKKS